MELKKLIELRNKVYEAFYIAEHDSMGYFSKKTDAAISDFITAGREYYYNPKLTFLQLHKLIMKEEMSYAGIKPPISRVRVDFEELIRLKELIEKKSPENSEMETDKSKEISDFITAGRIYFENPNLTYEQLNGLFNLEHFEYYESKTLKENISQKNR